VTALGGGGLVTFNCGALPKTIVVTYTSGIVLNNTNTTLDGDGLITLSGNGTHPLFSVLSNSSLTLTEITLADGYVNYSGAAIFNEGRTVLDDVIIRDTYVTTNTWGGGAIYNAPSALLIARDSVLRDNAALEGGAIWNDAGGHVLVEDSQFIDNTAYGLYGGAIRNGGSLTLTGGLFSGNALFGSASIIHGGGAVANVGAATATSTDVTYSDNSAIASGGAIFTSGAFAMVGGLVDDNTAYYGGGIIKADESTASLTLSGTTLSDNDAIIDGGGLYVDRGTVNITGTLFLGNTAGTEGGGVAINRGRIIVADSQVIFNEAVRGGGIAGDRGAIELLRSTVSGNTASSDGGGLWGVVATDLALDRSTVSGNEAGNRGGGVYVTSSGSTLNLVNSTVSGNSADLGGGLFANIETATSLWNVTVAENSATTGGGLYITGSVTMALTNTLVANSLSGGDCAGAGTITAEDSLASDATCALSPGNQNSTDPLLTELADFGGPTQTHMPEPDSPAIDGVVGSNAPAIDQRGEPRPAIGGYDIGAVERQKDDTELVPRLWLPLVSK
jgi:hypothetical protein